ncbi:MAG TPA: hypothetical protein DIT42_04690, partial [Gammaproteobacteria bacterium]|nr:hypothetical protein [Gammaproteobacteria bacterium]
MAQFIEFLSNHPILVGCWLAAFIGIMVYHQRTGSKGASPAQAITLINRSDAINTTQTSINTDCARWAAKP